MPKLYDEELVRNFVAAALSEFASYGIAPQNFAKLEGDRLFGYAISFSVFNGNATFVLGRDGLTSTVINGQTQRDAELMKDLLNRAHRCLPQLESITHLINGFCHAEFMEGGNPEELFRKLIATTGPAKSVAASVLSEDAAEVALALNERSRLDIAPSEARENRLFMSWHFIARGVVSDEFWQTIEPRLNRLSGSLGIEVV